MPTDRKRGYSNLVYRNYIFSDQGPQFEFDENGELQLIAEATSYELDALDFNEDAFGQEREIDFSDESLLQAYFVETATLDGALLMGRKPCSRPAISTFGIDLLREASLMAPAA